MDTTLPLVTTADAVNIGGYGCFYVLPLWLLAATAAAAPAVAVSGGYDCGSCFAGGAAAGSCCG